MQLNSKDLNRPEDLAGKLRAAMRGHACSVVILSIADKNGTRYAMVATSATSLTLDPPAMLLCVNRRVSCYPLLSTGADFCINILTSEHLPIAELCTSAKGEARFATGEWKRDSMGVPFLSDAQAAIFCTQDQRISYGTHDIFIAQVRDVLTCPSIDPLIYFDGAYKTLQTQALVSEPLLMSDDTLIGRSDHY